MRARSMKCSRNRDDRSAMAVDRGSRPDVRLLTPSRRRALALLVCLITVGACRQDMHNQPKYIPLRDSEFFKDGSSARPLVEDTVARGTLQEDAAFYTGKENGAVVATLPFPLTQEVLDRGEQRFNIYCAPCHDRTGSGNGMVVQRGYRQPPSFHIGRLRTVGVG